MDPVDPWSNESRISIKSRFGLSKLNDLKIVSLKLAERKSIVKDFLNISLWKRFWEYLWFFLVCQRRPFKADVNFNPILPKLLSQTKPIPTWLSTSFIFSSLEFPFSSGFEFEFVSVEFFFKFFCFFFNFPSVFFLAKVFVYLATSGRNRNTVAGLYVGWYGEFWKKKLEIFFGTFEIF